MKSLTSFLFSTFALAILFDSASAQQSSLTGSVCNTKRGSKSVSPVPTSIQTVTTTVPVKQVVTSTPSFIITPPTKTFTSTIIVTTTSLLPRDTATFTLTDFITSIETSTLPLVTDISSITVNTTVTSIVSTETTISTLSSWLPAGASIPGTTAAAKRELSPLTGGKLRRDGLQQIAAISKITKTSTSYPNEVTCLDKVKVFSVSVSTKTAQKTTTITGPTPTSIFRTTSTKTIITTTTPALAIDTTTVFETSTSLFSPTTTITTTLTATIELVEAIATTYAACSPDNLISSINGNGIAALVPLVDESLNLGYTTDSDPYDCCVSCFNNPSCAATYFFAIATSGEQCAMFLADNPDQVCLVNEYSLAYFDDLPLGPGAGAVISNGICGVYNSANNINR